MKITPNFLKNQFRNHFPSLPFPNHAHASASNFTQTNFPPTLVHMCVGI